MQGNHRKGHGKAMKKFVIILLAACLLLGCGIGYFSARSASQGSGEPVALYDPENVAAPEISQTPAAPEGEPEETQTAAPARRIDFDAIRALYPLDEVVGDVDGREVTWEEYFYWLADMGSQAQNCIDTMAMYGQSLDWEDLFSSEYDDNFAQYTVRMAQDCVRQMSVVEAVAEENGVTLSEADREELAAQHKQDVVGACGEGAGEEEFNAYLEQNRISRAMYDRLNALSYLFRNINTALYGENGSSVSEEEAMAFLREKEYLCASHILFLTIDPTSYEPLEESVAAQKLEQAKAVSDELRAIEDDAARAARFAELKEQYCEDSGKASFPEGYLFTPGTMVSEFEDGVKALGDYEVSEPILSAYGYHVIMRLPLSVDMTMDYSDLGVPLTARAVYADTKYGELMSGRIEASELHLRDDVAAFDLTRFLRDAE